MSTAGSLTGLEIFEALEIEYEHAYRNNPFKVAAIEHAMTMIPAGSRVLDVGCGTGAPVTELLSNAGLDVHAFDISPKMVEHTRSRFKGTFQVADMLDYPLEGRFSAIFIIFSHLSLLYADFHRATHRYANALEPGGVLVIGQMPSDRYVKDESAYDSTHSYIDDYPLPFMGKDFNTLAMTAEGQRSFLMSMGLEIVYETIDSFQPESEKCEPEDQQYIIARRPESLGDKALAAPIPLPQA